MRETKTLPRAMDGVSDLDADYQWPDGMRGKARDRLYLFSAEAARGAGRDEARDPFAGLYFSLTSGAGGQGGNTPAEAPEAVEQAPAAGEGAAAPSRRPEDVVRAGRALPGSAAGPMFSEPAHPLAYHPEVLDRLQDAIDAHSPGRFVAANPDASFATLTTTTHGAPRAWGRNVLMGPRLLSAAAGVPAQPIEAVLAQFPQLTLPTAQPLSGEGVSLVEYASSAAGSVTLGRFGRWTDMSKESLIGADAAAVTGMHRIGIALDLDKVLIDATNTAAGAAVAFNADVPGQIRKAIAQVLANTATEDPANLVVLVHPDNANLVEAVTPTGGQTIGERFQRFAGALVYPSTAVPTGFMIVANLKVGARYFQAMGLQTLTDVNVKTGVETIASFIIAGYGVTLTAGFAVKQDVVTP